MKYNEDLCCAAMQSQDAGVACCGVFCRPILGLFKVQPFFFTCLKQNSHRLLWSWCQCLSFPWGAPSLGYSFLDTVRFLCRMRLFDDVDDILQISLPPRWISSAAIAWASTPRLTLIFFPVTCWFDEQVCGPISAIIVWIVGGAALLVCVPIYGAVLAVAAPFVTTCQWQNPWLSSGWCESFEELSTFGTSLHNSIKSCTGALFVFTFRHNRLSFFWWF